VSDLLVIEFPSEEKAEEIREKLLAMQQEYLIELGDAVVAAGGALGGKLTDLGINDNFMREAARTLVSS
jgi:uncharacterized membrane protein